MGSSAEVAVRIVDEDTAEVTVGGEELGLLIGPGGATLSALQEVTRTVVQRTRAGTATGSSSTSPATGPSGPRPWAEFSRKVADEVITAGEERALEPMSPPDRKVVHDAVNEIDGRGHPIGGRGAPPVRGDLPHRHGGGPRRGR